MQTATSLPTTSLTAIQGFKGNETQLHHYTEAAYTAMYSSLWNGVVFTADHVQQCKSTIRQWLLNRADTAAAYDEFVQRVLLARLYLQQHAYSKLPDTPLQWLNPDNSKGFAGTEAWFSKLQAKRAALPLYQLPLKAFAEAVLDMQEEPTGRNFHYWRGYLIEHECQGLLNLFLSVVAWGRWK